MIIIAPIIVPYGTCQCCAKHTPSEREDEQVIEYDVQNGKLLYCIAWQSWVNRPIAGKTFRN